jgi:lysozyme
MQDFSYSDKGLALTKSFEGLRLEAYCDCAGVWTIGYGHVGPAFSKGMKIDAAMAEALLRADIAEAVACVNGTVTATISQNQFDAMVDFCFNAGRGNFLQSTLRRKTNLGDFEGAEAQFGLWVHAGGEVAAGLVRRRRAEAKVFGSLLIPNAGLRI